jgi:hypothetical protein
MSSSITYNEAQVHNLVGGRRGVVVAALTG